MCTSKKLVTALSLAVGLLASATCFAGISSKTVEYSADGKAFEGLFVSSDQYKGDRPVIVMIHNWMGVTDETKKQATRFAELGYDVFAADIYGKGIRPQDPKAAGEQATLYKTDRKLFRDRLNLALTTALAQAHTNKKKVAVVGYCFGGTGAIELARSGANLKAAISFHGG